MKVEVTRKVEVKETVEVELPFFYQHDLMVDHADVVIYGKVEDGKATKITVSKGRSTRYELETEQCRVSAFGCYMTEEYASTQAKFEEVQAELVAAASAA